VDINKIAKVTAPAITEAIQVFRDNKVIIIPGGGGEYGKIELPKEEVIVIPNLGPKDRQMILTDY